MYKRILLLLALLCALTLTAAPKRFFATVDIADNYWKTYCAFDGPEAPKAKPITAGSYTLENMREMVDAVADMGFSRLYWISYCSEFTTNSKSVLKDGKPYGGRELLKSLAEFSHARGLEFFVVLKPTEEAGMLFPPACTVPEGMTVIDDMRGRLVTFQPQVAANPGLRLRRRMTPRPQDDRVASITLVNVNDAPLDFSRADFTLFAGEQNGLYHEVADFGVENTFIERNGRRCSAVVLRTDAIKASERFFLLKCGRNSDKPSLVNGSDAILELRNAAGEWIPQSIATGGFTRADLVESLVFTRLGYHPDDTRTPEAWLPPKGYGASLETTAFDYETGNDIPTIKIDGKAGGGYRSGFIAFASQEREYLACLNLCYDEVMDIWKEAVEAIVYAGADGMDFRLGNHASFTLHGDDYGFNGPAVEEYKRRYGVDPAVDDNFDRALWRRLNGERLTEFMRWCAALLHGKGMRLHAHLSMSEFDRDFSRLNDCLEHVKYPWKQWMDEGLIDGISLKYMPFPWGARAGAGVKSSRMLMRMAKERGIESSIEARTMWWIQPTDSTSPPFTDAEYNELRDRFSEMMRSEVDALNFYEVGDYFMIDAHGKPRYPKRFVDLLADVRKAEEDETGGSRSRATEDVAGGRAGARPSRKPETDGFPVVAKADFAAPDALKSFSLYCHEGYKAKVERLLVDGIPSAKLTIDEVGPGRNAQQVQLRFLAKGVVQPGTEYRISFRCKVLRPAIFTFCCRESLQPWEYITEHAEGRVAATAEWQRVEYCFTPHKDGGDVTLWLPVFECGRLGVGNALYLADLRIEALD